MDYKILETKRKAIAEKIIVGIDPGKEKHQAAVLNRAGIHQKTFTFQVNPQGYRVILWKKLDKIIAHEDFKDVVFALETSCNLWQTLAQFLHYSGYPVLLVSPLTTHYSRSFLDHDFSHTDPKDALLMASNARSGYFDFYQVYSAEINAMHELSLIYCKMRKTLQQQRARLRAYIEYVFPEFLRVVKLDTETARYLLKDYFLAHHYLNLDVVSVGRKIAKISQNQYGCQTLEELQKAAKASIGIIKSGPEILAGQLAIESWLAMEAQAKQQQQKVKAALIELVGDMPEFEIIKSLKGVSDLLAALFIAETRDLALYNHWKQIEKLAGLNLRLIQSGKYVGRKRISHIGNRRLSWILYWMCEQTSRSVPEIRIKYLKRQLHRPCYRKSLIACVPVLLKLIMLLVKEQRPYEFRDAKVAEMKRLERECEAKKANKKKSPRTQ
ncbi:IS110 family transposase [Candidatus Pacearchaeota archaeon]|nr:MAG: IS110 family transposase [Candidatus Pacearchaeota archaeon]